MKEILKIVLILVSKVSSMILLIYGVIGIVAELLNPPVFEKLLSKLNIPLNYDELWMIGWINLAVFIITNLVKKYFFGE